MKLMLAIAAAALMVGCSSAKTRKSTSATSAAQTSSTTSSTSGLKENTVTCTRVKKSHKDTRTIMVAIEKHRCVVQYTKFGKTKEIATGKATSKHCSTVQDHIKKSLTKAGFSCQ